MSVSVEPFKKRLIALQNEVIQRINSIDKDIRHEGMSADWSEQATERENDEVLNLWVSLQPRIYS